MQALVCIGPSVPLTQHWHHAFPDRDTQARYADARGRCFNVTFVTPPRALASLVFRNYYCASLRLVQLNTDGSTRVLLDDHPLMAHAHCEDDAQKWHLLHLDQLHTPPDIAQLTSLQFYLFQPSPLFETWELHELKLYQSRSKTSEQFPTAIPIIQEMRELKAEPPSMHPLTRRLSHSSTLVVDAQDVRDNASQILTRLQELRHLVHSSTP